MKDKNKHTSSGNSEGNLYTFLLLIARVILRVESAA